MTPPHCEYPNCPSGQWAVDVKDDLKVIQANQDKHYEAMTKFGSIIEQIASLQRDMNRHENDHNEIFTRLRSVENSKVGKQDLVWGVATLGVIFAIIQVIIKLA